MPEEWFAVVGHDVPLTQGDIIVDCPLLAGSLAREHQAGLVAAAGGGELADGSPLRAVAEQLDEALLCFNLLQEELGLPAGQGPRYGRLLEEREDVEAARG